MFTNITRPPDGIVTSFGLTPSLVIVIVGGPAGAPGALGAVGVAGSDVDPHAVVAMAKANAAAVLVVGMLSAG